MSELPEIIPPDVSAGKLTDTEIVERCRRIRARLQDSAQAIIDVGRELLEMRERTAHGQWQRCFADDNPERLPFGDRTAQMLMKIAGNEQIANPKRVSDLPPSWGTLYELSKLPEDKLQRALDAGRVTPDMERKDVKALRYGHGGANDEGLGDEWYTPAWLFDGLGLTFDLDVCGPVDRTHVTVPCAAFYTPHDDGLTSEWRGLVWCNPPYSDPAPWARKCVEHGNGLLLTHVPMNAEWAAEVWRACDGLRLFQAMEFVRPDGARQRPGYWLQLAAFGDQAATSLRNLAVPEDVAQNPRRVPSPMWRAA